jgi:hypothetical protein
MTVNAYVINGTTLALQPTSGGWVARESFGLDGNGHPIYEAVRQFRLEWAIDSMSDWYELQNLFDTIYITGSVVVELPQYDGSTYNFREYSGCVVQEPSFDRYFNNYPTNVRLLISNIRT